MSGCFRDVDAVGRVALEYVAAVQDKALTQNLLPSKAIAISHGRTADSNEGNPSYAFDRESNDILLQHLEQHGLNCHLFSEEEGDWRVIGCRPTYFVVCDPFCNSWLAAGGFREAAVAICIADADAELVACAIGDLQIRRIFFTDRMGASVWHAGRDGSWDCSPICVNSTKNVSEAFLVMSLLKQERRHRALSSRGGEAIITEAKFLHTVDGAIMIGRLAAGEIDAYADPFRGQPLHEIPCCALILQAGGVVSNTDGIPFRLPDVIAALRKSRDTRYRLVAACTRDLHEQLLAAFEESAEL